MIIAAFAGVGKTYFCNNIHNAMDFVCMPYKYFMPETKKDMAEDEQLKGDFSLEMNPMYPSNYIKSIMDNIDKYEYLVIPSDKRVLKGLRNNKVSYILCYPTINAKDEYRKRYLRRGNTEDFIEIFIGRWDSFMKSLRADDYGIHIEMNKHEHLLDVKKRIDKIIMNQPRGTDVENLGDIL